MRLNFMKEMFDYYGYLQVIIFITIALAAVSMKLSQPTITCIV